MSRGAGRVERAIAAAFDDDPDNAFTTEDLAERVFAGINRAEKKHRVSVLRAAKTLVGRGDRFSWLVGERLGQQRVFFDRYRVLSYGMARLKAGGTYRSADERLHFTWIPDPASVNPDFPYRCVPGRPPHEKTEQEFRAMLEPGGKHYEMVSEGGVVVPRPDLDRGEGGRCRSGRRPPRATRQTGRRHLCGPVAAPGRTASSKSWSISHPR